MKRTILSLLALLAIGATGANAAVTVAASIPDLASIATAIGGNRIEAFSLAKAESNPHSVEVLPSYMVKVARAKVFLKVGLGLDGWADAIVKGSRNRDIEVVDCSHGIEVLEKPTGKVDASMGDVHPEGNPHYWLDPENGAIIARTVAAALAKADPEGRAVYEAGLARFEKNLEARRATWNTRMAPFKGQAVFTYHSSWPYFARAYGLRIVGKVEPVPGIPPNARHLSDLLGIAKAEHVTRLLQEPYFPKDGGEFLHRQAGIAVLALPPSCKGSGAEDYFTHFDALVAAFAGAK
jgi:zinc/manganese transport system substrate-binding protein